MVTRLSGQDATFYYLDNDPTPAQVGSLALFRAPKEGFEYEDLLALVEERLPLVPRYRQRVREVLRGLARPVWVDDAEFDITYHVRRSALPGPGTVAQLEELVARLLGRPLDRRRPLWEMYLIEGLVGGRFALFTKSHQAIVDGGQALEIGQVVLDSERHAEPLGEDPWMPQPEPPTAGLVMEAVAELVARPTSGADVVRRALGDVRAVAGKVWETADGVLSLVRSAAATAPSSPLNGTVSGSRRYATAESRLGDYRKVRARCDCSINDVVLAVIAGALRTWLTARGETVTTSSSVRALVPISVYGDDDGQAGPQGLPRGAPRVASMLVDLPIGEPNPMVRLYQVAHATRVQSSSSRSVAAGNLVRLSGFAPATMHAMGARLAGSVSGRTFNLIVSNAPGPQHALYAGGAKMMQIHPAPPLVTGQVLTIGVTSYDGGLYFGLNADRDAMPDVALLAEMLGESLEELLDACR